MNITIARKSHGAGCTYIVVAVLGLISIVYGCINPSFFIPFILVGVVTTVLCGIYAIRYLSLPSAIIVLTDDNTLLLPKGVTIPLEELCDVSYKRAATKGVQYRWGAITLTTRSGVYKLDFVCDCEEVSKHLTRQMYAIKYGSAPLKEDIGI